MSIKEPISLFLSMSTKMSRKTNGPISKWHIIMHIKLKEKRSNCEDKETNMCFLVIKYSTSEFTNGIKVAKSHVL